MERLEIKKSDVAFATSDSSHYDWPDEDTWHYFKYEPIKWRILKVEGNQALLLSDIALDDQRYNMANEKITWETSTIRSWLNGYGSSFNAQGIDYSSDQVFLLSEAEVYGSDALVYGVASSREIYDEVRRCKSSA